MQVQEHTVQQTCNVGKETLSILLISLTRHAIYCEVDLETSAFIMRHAVSK